MDRTNGMYGHRHVLAMYVGLAREVPLWGHLQHAWNPDTPFLATDPHSRWWPQFVWNARNLDAARRLGFGSAVPVIPIGDPFLYLMSLLGGVPGAKPHGEVAACTGRTIMYPRHSDGRDAFVPRSERLADDLLSRAGRDVTVCLHFYDYINRNVRQVYERRGFRVISHGAVHDRHFLYAQYAELLKHDRVVANAAGTALFHGGALGLTMQVFGPEFTEPTDDAWNFSLEEQAGRWPAMFGEGIAGPEAVRIADEELGRGFVRSPEELTQMFGWTTVGRARNRTVDVLLAPRRRWQDVQAGAATGGWLRRPGPTGSGYDE